MKIAKTSAWNSDDIESFLGSSVIPLRLALNRDDYPLLATLWFRFEKSRGVIQCVSHESSRLVRELKNNSRCAFEIAPNEPPYKGVRGDGDISFARQGAGEVLQSLCTRYLQDTNPALADWLMSRVDGEYLIEISPRWLSAWDYSGRMK
jgi:nitroimidazol reductase NimA-like FMN-containing flavoprotein (pyridoxamine 5'-phosphate oxidase superfamily)